VEYTAAWCGPCRVVAPVFAQLAATHSTALFLKQHKLAQLYAVRAMPTFHVFLGG
ncbi:hypothetical protein T492DRAFT_567628, partial [Pavlovales sp. CCMP2436]